MDYNEACEELTRRILALIPDHPAILVFAEPWDLFQVPGFQCDDIGPSYMQASCALATARHRYRNNLETNLHPPDATI